VPQHGTSLPRGQEVEPDRNPLQGRFGRMLPGLLPCNVSDAAIEEIVAWMGDPNRSRAANPRIPAGFTYLGQFIDHDITFDPTSKLDRDVDPRAVVNFRTPRLDLDSVYGSGRVAQPFLYDWDAKPSGVKLLIEPRNPDGSDEVVDLPRNVQGRALVGDARNDETAIIAQLQLLFLRFHNAVVDRLHAEGLRTRDRLFDTARRLVRWHYQWIVLHEFLPMVVGDALAQEVLTSPADGSGRIFDRRFFTWEQGGDPFIPVEFSGAAYRFGHSMVRRQYDIKRMPAGAGHTLAMVRPVEIFPLLAGFKPLRQQAVIAWERFFAIRDDQHPPQASQKIDTAIVTPLFQLPGEVRKHRELPRRNLQRGRALGLPSGQDVAAVMHKVPLTEDELELEHMPETKEELMCSAPLWYYILCETSRAVDADKRPERGRHLGPVGGRIVAEVLAGLLEGDRNSYVHSQPPWQPTLGRDGNFTMADLVRVAQGE
jgi:Animal haem peroxidase